MQIQQFGACSELGYGPDDQQIWVQFAAGERNYQPLHGVQNDHEAHPSKHSIGNDDYFRQDKAGGA